MPKTAKISNTAGTMTSAKPSTAISARCNHARAVAPKSASTDDLR